MAPRPARSTVLEKQRAFNRIIAVGILLQVGYGIIFPVIPLRPAEILGTSDDDEDSQGAFWHGVTTFLSGMIGMFLAPIVGSLSDVFGRRRLLALMCLAASAEAAASGLADDMVTFTIGRCLGGLAQTYWSVILAAVIDVSDGKEDKSRKIGVLMGLTMGIGFVIGPVIGGFLGHAHAQGPYYAACGTALASAVLAITIIPETAPNAIPQSLGGKDDDGQAENKPILVHDTTPSISTARSSFNPFRNFAVLAKSKQVVILSTSTLLGSMAVQGFAACGILFLDYKFHWSKQELGMHMGLLGLSFLISQAVLLPLIVTNTEAQTIDIAIASSLWGVGVGVAYAALMDPGIVFWLAALVGPVGIHGVVIIAMVSDTFPSEVQGRVSGCLLLLDRLGRITGAVTLTSMFAALTDGENDFAEIVPLMLSVFTLLAMLILLFNRHFLLVAEADDDDKTN